MPVGAQSKTYSCLNGLDLGRVVDARVSVEGFFLYGDDVGVPLALLVDLALPMFVLYG